jgi:hypothetical protein
MVVMPQRGADSRGADGRNVSVADLRRLCGDIDRTAMGGRITVANGTLARKLHAVLL